MKSKQPTKKPTELTEKRVREIIAEELKKQQPVQFIPVYPMPAPAVPCPMAPAVICYMCTFPPDTKVDTWDSNGITWTLTTKGASKP